MLYISNHIIIYSHELEFKAIRAQGSGGQNVNKVSSAIHLRFDVRQSSLPEQYKERILNFNDRRISSEGIIVIKAQVYRDQEKNRDDALQRLKALIQAATHQDKKRLATKPSRSSQRKRLDNKNKRGQLKQTRKAVKY